MRQAFGAAVHPPLCADVHVDPPGEAFRHVEDARNTEMAGGVSAAYVFHPRSHQEWYIDAHLIIERRSA